MGGTSSTVEGEKRPNIQAGDGIRSVRTTSVFKAVNFELYVKPNLAVMAFGVVAILCSTGYLAYMKLQHRESKSYVAIAEDDTQHLYQKRSKWD
ncbi:small integral membrane protein 8 [Palaemon carinicauda]|uniref:small integral membrane protein 8 n=1 Tax=Palaemon carinicauda TaxID=392227 RepID=UPI0035B64955